MKRTCCFTTPKDSTLIFSNMEFYTVGKRIRAMKHDTQIAVG